jgi:hypothetical protein
VESSAGETPPVNGLAAAAHRRSVPATMPLETAPLGRRLRPDPLTPGVKQRLTHHLAACSCAASTEYRICSAAWRVASTFLVDGGLSGAYTTPT